MGRETKEKQVVVRFDKSSYDKINELANFEHRGLGEFVRHATLVYIETYSQEKGMPFLTQLLSGSVNNISQTDICGPEDVL